MAAHLARLNSLLAANPVDLEQVAAKIRADRRLAARLLRLSHLTNEDRPDRMKRIEEAVILMGTERLRTAIFSGYLMELSGRQLAESATLRFWTHSLATAMMSERVARSIGYAAPDRAYQSGLMHDMGKLPLLMVAASGESGAPEWLERDDRCILPLERQLFGLDHCQAGRGLGQSWDFDPGQIEVLEWHHHPEGARFEPELVGIVALADHFCHLAESGDPGQAAVVDDFYRKCVPRLSERELVDLLALLEREYPLLRRRLEPGPTDCGPRLAASRDVEPQIA